MTKYKLTEKAIAEKFDMLCGLTIDMINLRVNEVIEERVRNGALIPVPYRMIVELSRMDVAFKDPDMNKLFGILDSYKFQVYSGDIEEEEEFPKELKKITTGVWYDVEDIINEEYDLDEALDEAYDVLVCDLNSEEAGLDDNFTANHRSYQVGYLDKNEDNDYVLVSKCREQELGNFVRLMFIPAETKEE